MPPVYLLEHRHRRVQGGGSIIPTYPEYRVYDFRACDHCTDGLLVEVRGNINGEIWAHTHCFQCGRDTAELVRRAAD